MKETFRHLREYMRRGTRPADRMRARAHPRAGFTLLLAALVASAVLSIGAAIYALAVKEVRLSSVGRESQFAFYAADSGAECALYWDVRHAYFDLVAPADVLPPDPQCAGRSLNAAGRTGSYPQTMSFSYDNSSGRCVQVCVQKCLGTIQSDATLACGRCVSGGTTVATRIHADGYNNACANLTADGTLQRSVEVNY